MRSAPNRNPMLMTLLSKVYIKTYDVFPKYQKTQQL